MIGQHDAAGAHPQGFGLAGNVADQHRRCRTADAFHVVVFGQPEAAKVQAFGVAGIGNTVGEGGADGVAFADRRQLKEGEGT